MTVTDILETVFIIRGADALIGATLRQAAASGTLATARTGAAAAAVTQNLAQTAMIAPLTASLGLHFGVARSLVSAVTGFQALAQSQGVAAAATSVLNTALGAINPVLLVIAAGIAVLVGSFLLIKASLSAFSASEDAIGRLAIRLRDSGNAFPIADLQRFASGLQSLTGISDEVITSLGATAAQFGLTRAQIEKLLPTVLDISVALKKPPEEIEKALLRASRGRPQGLVALGIDPAKIKGDLHDVNNLISQVGAGFAGTAAAFRDTLPGTVSALQNSVTNLFEAIGRFISPVVVPLLNVFIAAIDKATALLQMIANAFPGLFPTAARLGEGKANPLALKGDPEQTAALHGIEDNTGKMHAAISKVLGGSGEVARRAWTVRDQRIAWGI